MSDLPRCWASAALAEVVDDARPGFPSGRHNDEGIGVPHLRPMNVGRDGRIDLETVRYVEDGTGARIQRGDVLFNNTNSPDLVGKTAFFDRSGDWAYSNHMTRLRPSCAIDGRFLAIQLHWLWMTGFYKTILNNHVNQASVAAKNLLANVRVLLPPLAEQRRIVAAIEEHLSRLDAATEAVASATRRLDVLRRSVLQADIGKDWPGVMLGDVAQTQLGKMLSAKARAGTAPRPYLRNKNVQWWRIEVDDLLEMDFDNREAAKFELRPGDVLVCEGGEVGRAAVWRGEVPDCRFQKALHRVRPTALLNGEYLVLVLRWLVYRNDLDRHVAGSTIAHLPQEDLRRLRIPLPPRDDQDRIVGRVHVALEAATRLEAAAAAAGRNEERLRRSILARAFRGELVSQDPDDEPASVLLERIAAERAAAPKPPRRRRAPARR